MPLKPIDFTNAVVYKIVCKDTDIPDTYVGSTTNFTKRKCSHKFNCNNQKSNGYNLQVYQFIRAHDGWNNWDMIEIEKYPCNDSNELHARERYWIETLKSSLNKQIPTQTVKDYKQQYFQDHKSEILEYKQQYRETHKQTCECGCVVQHGGLPAHMKTKKHKTLMEQLNQLKPSSLNNNLIVEKTI